MTFKSKISCKKGGASHTAIALEMTLTSDYCLSVRIPMKSSIDSDDVVHSELHAALA